MSILDGNYGANASFQRFAKNGAHSVLLDIKQSATRNFGNWQMSGWPTGLSYNVLLTSNGTSASGTGSRNLIIEIPQGQTFVPRGAYTASFSGTETRIVSASGNTLCSTLDANGTNLSRFPFNVTVNVVDSCVVTTAIMDFGSVENVLSTVDVQGSIGVKCTNGLPYSVGVDKGVRGNRVMQSAKGDQLSYNLFSDAARTLTWGNSIGVDTKSGVGSGIEQLFVVYGRIPAITSLPRIGTYTDNVVVTLNY